jgi:hypothetical protein
MCAAAKERLKRYQRERRFRSLREELHYTELAVYLY